MTIHTPLKNFRKGKLEEIMKFYGNGPFCPFLDNLYTQGLSSFEISEKILKETKIQISARSIQRALERCGVKARPTREAFNLAYNKGRVVYKNAVPYALVYNVMREKGFFCSQCRTSAEESPMNGWYTAPREKGKRMERQFVLPLCENCFRLKCEKETTNPSP